MKDGRVLAAAPAAVAMLGGRVWAGRSSSAGTGWPIAALVSALPAAAARATSIMLSTSPAGRGAATSAVTDRGGGHCRRGRVGVDLTAIWAVAAFAGAVFAAVVFPATAFPAAFAAAAFPAAFAAAAFPTAFADVTFAGGAFAEGALAGAAFADAAFAGVAFAGVAFSATAFAGAAFVAPAFAVRAFTGATFAGGTVAGAAFTGATVAGAAPAFSGAAFTTSARTSAGAAVRPPPLVARVLRARPTADVAAPSATGVRAPDPPAARTRVLDAAVGRAIVFRASPSGSAPATRGSAEPFVAFAITPPACQRRP
jgi:hypothetical protein